jgi:hypothetical protein
MTDIPTWHGKRAPTGLKVYPAWSSDPTPDPVRRGNALAGLGWWLAAIGAACSFVSWWLR